MLANQLGWLIYLLPLSPRPHFPFGKLSAHNVPPLFRLWSSLESPHCSANHHQRKPFRSCCPSPWLTMLEGGRSGCEERACPRCGEVLSVCCPFSVTPITHWPGKAGWWGQCLEERKRGSHHKFSLWLAWATENCLWRPVTSRWRWKLVREIPLTWITCWGFLENFGKRFFLNHNQKRQNSCKKHRTMYRLLEIRKNNIF